MKKSFVYSLLLTSVLFTLSGCHFYKIGTVKSISGPYLIEKQNTKDYLIVHFNDSVFQLANIRLEGEVIQGELRPLSYFHLMSIKNEGKEATNFRYKKTESKPTNEVHIFLSQNPSIELSIITIPIDQISKVEVYDEATGLTIASYVVTTSVIAFSAMMIYLAIVCGCPSLYVQNDGEYTFQGAVFPGAINSNSERDDYKSLGIGTSEGSVLRLKLANEKKELEYINETELMVINHPELSEVFVDRKGNILLFDDILSPEEVLLPNDNQLPEWINSTDNQSVVFNQSTENNGINSLVVKYNLPENTSKINVGVSFKNTEWMDLMFYEFFSMLGNRYESFAEKQSAQDPAEKIEWLKSQGVVLNVYVDKGFGWEYVDYFNVAGSAKFRTEGMIVDVSNRHSNELKLKLESGFGFWEIDQLIVDPTPDQSFSVSFIKPSKAFNQNNESMISELASDLEYIPAMKEGDELFLEFNYPKTPEGLQASLVFHSKGYYTLDMQSDQKAQLRTLKSLKEPGAFSNYSLQRFNELVKEEIISIKN